MKRENPFLFEPVKSARMSQTAKTTTTIEHRMNRMMEHCVNHMMEVITNNESFKDYVVNFNGNQGFMWDSDPRNAEICKAVDCDDHSGASYAFCLRECQRRLKHT
jgi:hypothetical protein